MILRGMQVIGHFNTLSILQLKKLHAKEKEKLKPGKAGKISV